MWLNSIYQLPILVQALIIAMILSKSFKILKPIMRICKDIKLTINTFEHRLKSQNANT